MTDREAQILSWIREDPLISQQEIANRAHITRSSVAVHISNLMRKGKIKGKGYVLQEEDYIMVIGAVNVDIIASSYHPLVDADSNPGTVSFSFGGVGRNIAENICHLGMPVEMITVLGDDVYAQEIQKHCVKEGIHLGHTLIAQHAPTSTYVCINDASGDMRLAVSAMALYEQLTPDYLQTKIDIINRAALVVVDTNLSQTALRYLAGAVKVPLFVDPVSTSKARKLLDILPMIHTLKPNRIEAELLSGVPIHDASDTAKAAQALLAKGIKQVFISLSGEGVYYASANACGILPIIPGNLVNTTGCGDAFMSGVCYGYIQEQSIEQAAKMGLAAASICASGPASISRELNQDTLLRTLESKGKNI